MTNLKSIQGTLTYENEDINLLPSFQERGYRTIPILYINGKRVPDHLAIQAKPNQTLLTFLRDVMHLTGSKLGCAEGGCGACTVMISRFEKGTTIDEGKVIHYSVNACLMPVLATDGCHITTIEGIGTVKNDNLHPIQKAMVDMHGSQCGFCTPGIIVAIYSLFANNPTKEYIEEHLDGNLCRCTGYRPIWDAARSLCADSKEESKSSTSCSGCPAATVTCGKDCDSNTNVKGCSKDCSVENICCSTTMDKMSFYDDTMKMDPSSSKWSNMPNDMFPNELKVPSVEFSKPLVVADKIFHSSGSWFKPTTLTEFLHLMKKFNGECKIVVGNTEVGIETRFKNSVYPRLIQPSHSISSLFCIETTNSHLIIGSCTSLSSIQNKCHKLQDDATFNRIAKPIHDMLRWFASTQIRNVACLGGNLVTASPISDMNPMLASMGAVLVLASCNEDMVVQRRNVSVSDFFVSYRKVDMKPYEIVESIHIPLVQRSFEYVFPFKQARRREDDISIVTAGMRIRIAPNGDTFSVNDVAIAFGGMAPKTCLAQKTMQYLIGKPFCRDTFIAARSILQKEFDLPDDVPGGQSQFRKTLASSFLYKLYLMSVKALHADVESLSSTDLPPLPYLDEDEESGCFNFLQETKPSSTGTQKYPKPKVVSGLEDSHFKDSVLKSSSMAAKAANKNVIEVGSSKPHASGPLHCTGEALYTDDVPLPPGTLQACLIMANKCNVELLSINTSLAKETPGVLAIYTHEDIEKLGGDNRLGPIKHDEYVFLPIGERVGFVGQVLGICIADTLESAEAAARLVDVKYGENVGKTIVSIEDAISAGSYYDFARHELHKDSPIVHNEDDRLVTVTGSFRCGGQEHFYLETNSTLAIPSESATNLVIYTSTQAVNETQKHCALATNTPANKVVVRMKRMGGGFGGKETRSVFSSCAAAIAAKLSDRPVRLTLARNVDMSITGGRHAFMAKYSASAILNSSNEVKLHSLNVELYSNGGSAFDLSGPVMDRALFHVDGPYYWPKFHAVGVPVKTVQPPHTAFRGFGGPQGLATCEHIIEHLSTECGVPSDTIRKQNLYMPGQATPFGMIMGENYAGEWHVPFMWDKLYKECDVSNRRLAISEFNKKHKWLKRGLAFTPTKFGIAFTSKFMNQGGALVHLYTDGTVLVTHGGTEMGQGLHTKVCAIAAQAFGISIEDVYVNDTSSDKVANTLPTAASMSTDLYGMATLDACRQILARIEPVREKLGTDASLKEVASAAFFERIDLSAHGFYKLDDIRCGFDWNKEKPDGTNIDVPENSWKGHPFNYFTQGVACTEVEIDVLTGNHTCLRADVLVDVGASINPSLDIGQIEGAFIQGMGWCTLEEIIYADDDHKWIRPAGKVFTSGPGTYKIPAFNDVPNVFNVSLLDDVNNPFAVHSSKAIGEPPFFLGCSVFFAIKDAISAARSSFTNTSNEYFELRMPATSERIRMSCVDVISAECISSVLMNEDEKLQDAAKNFQAKGSF